MGHAYCWGTNSWGQLGNGTNADNNVPVPVSGGLTFKSISAGSAHGCGVTTVGDGYCWGAGSLGRLGTGTNADSNVPVPVSGSLTFKSVSTGSNYSCGVTTAADGYCWGDGRFGALGDGTNVSSNVPVLVDLIFDPSVCHKGVTLYLPAAAVPHHLGHGDTPGACP
jgi:alpha-tubulin suppressor-like RCC1 family protein